MLNILILGAPGSGKGTQALKLRDCFSLRHISTGDLLREISGDTSNPFYLRVKERMDSGRLVETEIIEEIILNEIKSVISSTKYSGVLFDGFPRSKEQNDFLTSLCSSFSIPIDAVIYLDISLDVLVDRIANRFQCKTCGTIFNKLSSPTKINGICDFCGSKEFSFRSDDSQIDVIKQRFDVFKTQSVPIISYYNHLNSFLRVDASQGIEAVWAEIQKFISRIAK